MAKNREIRKVDLNRWGPQRFRRTQAPDAHRQLIATVRSQTERSRQIRSGFRVVLSTSGLHIA
jgi:hypothetical protein